MDLCLKPPRIRLNYALYWGLHFESDVLIVFWIIAKQWQSLPVEAAVFGRAQKHGDTAYESDITIAHRAIFGARTVLESASDL